MKDLLYIVIYVLSFYLLAIGGLLIGFLTVFRTSDIVFCLVFTIVVVGALMLLYRINKRHLDYIQTKRSLKRSRLWLATLLSPFIVATVLVRIDFKFLILLVCISPMFIFNVVFIIKYYRDAY